MPQRGITSQPGAISPGFCTPSYRPQPEGLPQSSADFPGASQVVAPAGRARCCPHTPGVARGWDGLPRWGNRHLGVRSNEPYQEAEKQPLKMNELLPPPTFPNIGTILEHGFRCSEHARNSGSFFWCSLKILRIYYLGLNSHPTLHVRRLPCLSSFHLYFSWSWWPY